MAGGVTAAKSVKVTPGQWIRLFSQHSGCPRQHRRVLWELAAFANDDGEWARPGVRLLAERVGLSKDDTIAPALEWGRANHWVRRTMKGNRQRKQADVYELTVPARLGTEVALALSTDHGTEADAPDPRRPEESRTSEVESATARTAADEQQLGGLTVREMAELRRLRSAHDEWEEAGKNPNAYPMKDAERERRLARKHRAWQIENGLWPPR